MHATHHNHTQHDRFYCMSPPPLLLLLLLLHALSVGGFGSLLFNRHRPNAAAIEEGCAIKACDACRQRLNHTLGEDWMRCVATTLEEWQKAAMENGSAYFPVGEGEYDRLRPAGTHGQRTDELMNIMRNFSCEVDDGGSQPIRSFKWSYHPIDQCGNRSSETASGYESRLLKGFLPAGNDLRDAMMTEEEATASCEADDSCRGVTFQAADGRRTATLKTQKHRMLFKSSGDGFSAAGGGWYTLLKKKMQDCSEEARRRRTAPREMTVHVLRESPPVYAVDDFASDAECEHMVSDTVPKMGRSVVGGGGTSAWRQSYSVNMNPDYDDEDNVITQMARRKFAFAREVVGYPVEEGIGQEPINAVYYYHDGDQYRPHCDGECHGAPYTLGSRVASSLVYCLAADKGGYTLFTRTHLKFVPRKRSMLFFGYFFNGTAPIAGTKMDDGWTEHTGCPTHAGRKWIATMWYRIGVTAEKDWAYWSRFGQHGV